MRIRSRWRSIAALAAAASLALPAVAAAEITYVKNPLHPVVYVSVGDGTHVQRIGPGTNPRLYGTATVVYSRERPRHAPELVLARTRGSTFQRVLMTGLREPFQLAISRHAKTIAALRGPELGKRKLALIDVPSGRRRIVATGYFHGFSFSPDLAQTELVYARSGRESFPSRSDVYRVPVSGGRPVRLTRDHDSQAPLWGPRGRIAFVKQLGARQRRYGPKNELYLMDSDGGQVKRLTHTRVGPLLRGLYPTDWSNDGRRLLAEFEGQDTSYAVAVKVPSGAQHPVFRPAERGFVGTALSGDGRTILGFTGGFEPGRRHDVATVPFAGGRPETKVRNAYEPDWSR